MLFSFANLLVKLAGFDFDKALKWARIIFVGGIILIVFFVGLLIYRACQPEAKIDQETIQKINSQNESERKEALNNYFEKIDQQREISDTERKEIIKKVEKETRYGKNVTAEDLERLVSEEN